MVGKLHDFNILMIFGITEKCQIFVQSTFDFFTVRKTVLITDTELFVFCVKNMAGF